MAISSTSRLPHLLLGSTTSNFVRVLLKYGGCAPSKLLKTLGILGFTSLGIPVRAWESLRYSRAIRNVELDREPIFVIGHWQSGTSPMHFLLALDPRLSYLKTLQATIPWAFLSAGWLVRPIMKRIIKGKDRGSDSFALHEGLPHGTDWSLATVGDLSIYHAYIFPKSVETVFRQGVLMDDLTPRQLDRWKRNYRYLAQKIAYANGKSRVLLRSAADTGRIRHLLDMFPNAKFVHMVRDPYEICQASDDRWESMCRIWSLQNVDMDRLHGSTIDFYERLMRRFYDDCGAIPPGNLATVRYEDMIGRPLETMQTLYGELNLGEFDVVRPAIEEYAARQTGSLAGEVQSKLSPERRAEIRRRLEFVFERTGYPLDPIPQMTMENA